MCAGSGTGAGSCEQQDSVLRKERRVHLSPGMQQKVFASFRKFSKLNSTSKTEALTRNYYGANTFIVFYCVLLCINLQTCICEYTYTTQYKI